jgi:hypothetical protein
MSKRKKMTPTEEALPDLLWDSRRDERKDEDTPPEFGIAADWESRGEEAHAEAWHPREEDDDEQDEEDEEEEESEPNLAPRASIEDVTLEALLSSHVVVNCGGQEFHASVMSALLLVSIVTIAPATFFVGIGVGLPAFWLAQRCLAR